MRPVARIAAVMMALVAAAPAWAQGPPRGPMQPLTVCLADYQRLCPGVPPGGGRIMACLNAQAEKLSQACFQALAERGLALTAALRLCRTDYDRLCPGVPVGRGQALRVFSTIARACRRAAGTRLRRTASVRMASESACHRREHHRGRDRVS